MSIRKLMKLGVIATVSAAMFGCGGGGGGGETPTPTPSLETKSGKVIHGYLANATVFVEYSNNCSAPSSTLTNATGDYQIEVNENCDYVLKVYNGHDLTLDEDFHGILKAPKGYKNITPFTTLAAVNPTAAEQIRQNLKLDSLDVDYVNATIPVDALEISQVIAEIIDAIGEIAPGDEVAINAVVNAIAERLATASESDLANDTVVGELITSAVVEALNSIESINVSNATTLQAGFSALVNSILDAVDDSVENASLNSTIGEAITTAISANSTSIDQISNATQSVKFDVGVIEIGGVSIYNGGNATLTESQVSENKTISIDGWVENHDLVGSENKTYEATFVAYVNDKNSNREATITLSPVEITLSNSTADVVSVRVPQDATLHIRGRNSNGELVDATYTNDLADVIRIDDHGHIIYDLEQVEQKLAAGGNEDLVDIGYPGNYEVRIVAVGFPMEQIEFNVVVTSVNESEVTPPSPPANETSNETYDVLRAVESGGQWVVYWDKDESGNYTSGDTYPVSILRFDTWNSTYELKVEPSLPSEDSWPSATSIRGYTQICFYTNGTASLGSAEDCDAIVAYASETNDGVYSGFAGKTLCVGFDNDTEACYNVPAAE
ncbi:hypothetical protein [Desulfurobacterium crinifex]